MGVHISNPNFRDTIGTIDADGKRNYLHPRKTNGRYTNYRRLTSYALLLVLVGIPFIQVNGRPFMLFNIIERKFILFGQTFWPADFFLAVLAMLILVLFVAAFTVAFGRLFCGWVCPQTIFMEHVFRRIEYWIDGDRNQQIRLSKMKWTAEKIRKRVFKNGIFYLISFGISNVFMMYLVGQPQWWKIVSDNPLNHISGLVTILIFSGVFFFVFAWFREQVCIMVCPYGRLQSVLLDRHSVVIAYDYIRGEIRSKFRKSENRKEEGKGDCIDCNQCVEVCPTGIDIRNGTQLECINCTACMDACDNVMDKIDLPKGLIRYDSEENIATYKKKIFTARVWGYSAVMIVLLTLFTFLLASRTNVEALVFRVPGQLYQKVDEQTLSNLFNYKILNKSTDAMAVEIVLLEPKGELMMVGSNTLNLKEGDFAEGTLIVYLKRADLSKQTTKLKLGILQNNEVIETVQTSFSGPIVRKTKRQKP